ncbi:MAG TPA: cytidylate kinase-like family protein [Candidatus Ventrousia excrementavium]|uniref:Cytidylate kinase-like family protein n=1 Tax=Candidatus Ventrousia excrementavium TaxID=2840961 RepID=A0A9D1IXR4_9CLOT|nr:cytidylate kinase-like family protein [Candidatus Ventrousia excrementavium]
MSKIITISREFGSGGRELGRRLAEELKIAYYDQEIVSEIAKRTELSEHYIRAVEERQPPFSFPIHIGRSFYPAPNPAWEQHMTVYQEQSRIIREMADKSDCVIVGRCADYVLRDRKPLRLFVYAELESKMRRCREKAPADEHLTDKELRQKIRDMDKHRSKYYEFLTGNTWSDKLNYDFCINTTDRVIKDLVPVIARLF